MKNAAGGCRVAWFYTGLYYAEGNGSSNFILRWGGGMGAIPIWEFVGAWIRVEGRLNPHPLKTEGAAPGARAWLGRFVVGLRLRSFGDLRSPQDDNLTRERRGRYG